MRKPSKFSREKNIFWLNFVSYFLFKRAQTKFFITFVPCPWLDGKHTVFGEVDEGVELLDLLERCGSQRYLDTRF